MTVIIVVTLVVAASVITAILLTRSEMTANEGDSLALTELITVSDIGQGWNSSTPRTYDIPTSIWGPCDRASVDLYGLDDDGKGLLVSSGVALYDSDRAAEESYARLFTMYEESNMSLDPVELGERAAMFSLTWTGSDLNMSTLFILDDNAIVCVAGSKPYGGALDDGFIKHIGQVQLDKLK